LSFLNTCTRTREHRKETREKQEKNEQRTKSRANCSITTHATCSNTHTQTARTRTREPLEQRNVPVRRLDVTFLKDTFRIHYCVPHKFEGSSSFKIHDKHSPSHHLQTFAIKSSFDSSPLPLQRFALSPHA